MAEIRANREYQFKEFCISEEIAKHPPIKTKRWTFHDSNPNNRFYNQPEQRKWDEKEFNRVNRPSENVVNNQYVKPFKKPSDLRAEFFNAYKKYYRRVDIKRVEVQSTLNVDAKFKGADESAEGESSLYKEKECMQINIIMDTEKDDALVSSKLQRTVLCEEGLLGKESKRNIGFGKMNIGDQDNLKMCEQNIVLGDAILDESACSSTSNYLAFNTDLPSEKDYFNHQINPGTAPILKQGQCSMNRTFVPLTEIFKNSNNIKIDENPPKVFEKVSIFNEDQPLAGNSDNGARYSNKFSFNEDNGIAGVVDEIPKEVLKDEKREYARAGDRIFNNSKIKSKPDNLVNGTPFKSKNTDEKSFEAATFLNRKKDFIRAKCPGYVDYDDEKEQSFSKGEDYFVPVVNDKNFNPGRFNQGSSMSPNAENNFNFAVNSNHTYPNEQRSDSDDILPVHDSLRNHKRDEPVSEGYNFEDWTPGLNKMEEKKPTFSVPFSRTESSQEHFRTKTFDSTNNSCSQATGNGVVHSNSRLGVQFRGLRGGPFNEKDKKELKSLVVNVIQGTPNNNNNNNDRNIMKPYLNSNQHKGEINLTQRNDNKASSNLEDRDAYSFPRKSFSKNENPDIHKSQFNYSDRFDSNYTHQDIPSKIQNNPNRSASSSDSKTQCSNSLSFKTARRDNLEEPFVIWTNNNRNRSPIESLQIDKLTMSDNDTDVGSDYDTNSNPQSVSDWYSVRDISDGSKIKLRKNQDQIHRGTEKRIDKTNSIEIASDSKKRERNENAKDGMERFPERGYSKVSSIPRKDSARPNHRNDDDGFRTSNSHHTRENKKWIDGNRGTNHLGRIVSQAYQNEEKFGGSENRQRCRPNIKLDQGHTVRGSNPVEVGNIAFQNDKIPEESHRISIGRDESAETKIFRRIDPNEYNDAAPSNEKNNSYEFNSCDQKISKSSNPDSLQIGPTYSLNYSPPHEKISRKELEKKNYEKWDGEKMEDNCHGRSANAYHCSRNNASDFIRKTRNETISRNGCNLNSYCDNYLNTCRHEMICNSYQPNSDINSCGCHNDSNIYGCDCEDFDRVPVHIGIIKNSNACSCHARDTNLHCHSRKSYTCLGNKHRRRVGCPCQGVNRTCCGECSNDEVRFLYKECSSKFQKCNNSHCSCARCEVRIDAACSRKDSDKCCACDYQWTCYPPSFDQERQWMSTGHQPVRNRCSDHSNIERCEELKPVASFIVPPSGVKEQFANNCGNHCSVNSFYERNRQQNPERSPANNDGKNYSCEFSKQSENVCQLENCGQDSAKDFKKEQKYHNDNNPAGSEEAKCIYMGSNDNSFIQDEQTGLSEKHVEENKAYADQEIKRFPREGKRLSKTSNRDHGKKITETKTLDQTKDEPLILSEEQWDSDDGLPMRRIIRKTEEKEQEQDYSCSSSSENEPSYLREEDWETNDREAELNHVSFRETRSTSVRYRNGSNYLWRGHRSADRHSGGRNSNFSDGEDYRRCSSVHAVSDPSFHCEEQWASDEEKCEDHKYQSTLPKNRRAANKGRDRRSFNPRRWDMVTDLPKNESTAIRNRNKMMNNYHGGDFGDTRMYQNMN